MFRAMQTAVVAVVIFAAIVQGGQVEQVVIDVGQREGTIRGDDHRAIQAAIDYAGSLGGGAVRVGPGRYTLRTCLTLRSGVKVIGAGEQTVLVLADGFRSPLAVDADANQREVTVADPSGFAIGDRVLIGDDQQAWGFRITSAQVIGRNPPATLVLSEPVRDDCMVQRHGWVERNCPAIGGWGIRDATIEGLTIEGNLGRTPCPKRDGCRNGGIYLFECENVAIRRCTVRSFNGDGISFQVSRRVVVEECLTEKNAGHGLHPGSGSQEPTLRKNRSLVNGEDGIFVCWRVQRGVFEANEMADNRGVGISIGHKDSDNLFRGNRIIGNQGPGIEFRPETEPMGAHRNVFENNVILDNGGQKAAACIVVRGRHDDLVFRGNTIGYTKARDRLSSAIATDGQAQRIVTEKNDLKNAAGEIGQLKPAN